MSRKPKSIETITAEEIDLDVDPKDDNFGLLDEHVAKEFDFVSRKYRIHFYRWLELLVSKLSRSTGVDLHNSEHNSGLLTHGRVVSLLGAVESELDLDSLWQKGRRAIRDRVREENKAERDRIVVIPISVSRRDKDRFENFKQGLDYEATNKDALIELLNVSESFEPEVKRRVGEKYANLLEENKKLKKAREGKLTRTHNRRRIERLEEALDVLFDTSFGMSVDDYIKHHRQLQQLEEGHKRIAAENDSSKENEGVESSK